MILLQNIKGVGKAGDIKDVSDGYARNYLLKNNLARVATTGALKENLAVQDKMEKNKVSEIQKLKQLAQNLSQTSITIKVKARDGKLFGSINKKMIIQELQKNKIIINESCLILNQNIREVGKARIKADFGLGIKVEFDLNILPE